MGAFEEQITGLRPLLKGCRSVPSYSTAHFTNEKKNTFIMDHIFFKYSPLFKFKRKKINQCYPTEGKAHFTAVILISERFEKKKTFALFAPKRKKKLVPAYFMYTSKWL